MGKFVFWIISPDAALRKTWRKALKAEGWAVKVCASPREFNSRYNGGNGVLLAEIPDNAGSTPETFSASLAHKKNLPVIAFAAAGKINPRQITRFLDSAADDFIIKDIDARILKSKLNTYLARFSLSPGKCEDAVLRSKDGRVHINNPNRTVKICLPANRPREIDGLTPKEFKILTLLIMSDGKTVSRELLLEQVWGEKADTVNPETVDRHIGSLRKKLGPTGKQILTIYGSGYLFEQNLVRSK
ncbi:MAG: hypothetical protein A2178_00670 [Planctomycetes bacterium GWC2_49_10]|nr:MAG: hypothetical protein A2178_00670 [Planctomycetes bacterium GWC2_49_10]